MKLNIIQRYEKFNLQRQPVYMDTEENQVDIFQNLPLKNENELEAMEKKLNDDSTYRKHMIKQFARILCQDMKTSCIRLMRQIFSNELAMKYSWYGVKKKSIFSNLQLCKIIMCVIRNSHANVTDDQISAPIKIWLAHAKERAAKEAARETAKEAATNDI
ncbi:PREDICTED: uncharacterized protein LOC105556021 [Vollenhovia emeryi]|uniref:uncharacterized protein LOC105556021 n=1 Tax=Vollenhovia emeryi TaxID=411798 RepID=UPI0005F36D42|nr:PREDICTED: uncharacterized protein LOC105556021 [Vollenhovia emeryi]